MSAAHEPTSAELQAWLAEHSAWELRERCLHREFQFPSFVAAFGFMAAAALVAERMDHHPEWANVYGTVQVDLTTHSIGGISQHDLSLGAAMDGLAQGLAHAR